MLEGVVSRNNCNEQFVLLLLLLYLHLLLKHWLGCYGVHTILNDCLLKPAGKCTHSCIPDILVVNSACHQTLSPPQSVTNILMQKKKNIIFRRKKKMARIRFELNT